MTGEEKRKWLQEIRRKVAGHNDIVYMQSEQHEEGCEGNCKVCQAEARYIDAELVRKARLGEDVKLSSILSEILIDAIPEYRKEDVLKRSVKDITDDNKHSNDNISKSTNGGKSVPIDELNLAVHLDSTVRRYGIGDTDELYYLLKDDSVNMKKKLRGGYRYLVELLKEFGYEITEDMI